MTPGAFWVIVARACAPGVDRRGRRRVAVADVLGQRAADQLFEVGQSTSQSTTIVRNAGPLAPCRRAPESCSSRR